MMECESCAAVGLRVPAIGQASNSDWAGYHLCQDCITEYDSRPVFTPPSRPNEFEAEVEENMEAEAEETIEALRELGEDWAEAEYRVREIEGSVL